MRINPKLIPHLVNKDSASAIPDGMRRGLIPSQKNISVQDVKDYSTPQGAAMANEEMRKLRMAVNKLLDSDSQVASQEQSVPVPATQLASQIQPAIVNGSDDGDQPVVVENEYTVYHNGIPVNEVKKNISTNYIDGGISEGDQYDVIFQTFGTGNDAHVKAFVKIPKTQLADQVIYSEEFYTDKYFSDEPHALWSNLEPQYIKFGTTVYHDVKHNFGIENYKELLWSIVYTGDTTHRVIPLVVPIDSNTVRVYASVRYGIDESWEYRNTIRIFIPIEEYISKESLPKFFITLYNSKNIIKFVLHGGYPYTVDYNSIIHGGFANTTIYNTIINGGKP
jgi:hypothetical protein